MNKKKRRGHPRFYLLLEELANLHSSKNHDYATDENPLRNLKSCEKMGIPAWKGVMVRLTDKWDRISNFVLKGKLEVSNETVLDTLMDNAVYSLLAIILLEETAEYGEVSDKS